MSAAIQAVWFIASLIALDYLIRYFGAAKTLCSFFALSSVLTLSIALPIILRMIARHHALLTLSLLVPGVLSVQAAIYGMAWWTVWKRKPSARAWAIAASLTTILLSLLIIWSNLHHSRPIWWCSGVMLAWGITGLVGFVRRDGQYDPSKNRTAS
jgi:hypothetical protein